MIMEGAGEVRGWKEEQEGERSVTDLLKCECEWTSRELTGAGGSAGD
jgi:hypothetical protein